MDKSLLTILLLSPGMVGIATSALFNGESNPPEIGKAVIKYFLYSCFAWILSELIFPDYVLSKVLQGIKLTTIEVFYPIIISFLLGAGWVLFIEKLLIKGVNILNSGLGRNQIFLEQALFDRLFRDQNYHFLEIQKDGKSIAKGYAQFHQGTERSLSLISDEEYVKAGYTERTKQYLVYLKDGIVLREYEYIELKTNE